MAGRIKDPKAFGKRISKAVNCPEALKILGPMIAPIPASWLNGGCCVFAMALQKYLGFGRLMMIERDCVNRAMCGIGHIVLEVDGNYFDAEGCHTKTQLLKRWKLRNAPIYLKRFNREAVRKAKIRCPKPGPIVRYLERELPRPNPMEGISTLASDRRFIAYEEAVGRHGEGSRQARSAWGKYVAELEKIRRESRR